MSKVKQGTKKPTTSYISGAKYHPRMPMLLCEVYGNGPTFSLPVPEEYCRKMVRTPEQPCSKCRLSTWTRGQLYACSDGIVVQLPTMCSDGSFSSIVFHYTPGKMETLVLELEALFIIAGGDLGHLLQFTMGECKTEIRNSFQQANEDLSEDCPPSWWRTEPERLLLPVDPTPVWADAATRFATTVRASGEFVPCCSSGPATPPRFKPSLLA
jgi:hypothetical protein